METSSTLDMVLAWEECGATEKLPERLPLLAIFSESDLLSSVFVYLLP